MRSLLSPVCSTPLPFFLCRNAPPLPVPFDEDEQTNVWYLDHVYHETMFTMFKKVNATEKVVGWYSTGPEIRPADLDIHELIRRYTPEPLLVIIDVDPKDNLEIPTKAYASVESVPEIRAAPGK